MLAKIYVTPKEGVLDPQGNAVKHSLETLGFKDVEDVRVGKYIIVRLSKKNREAASKQVMEMCEQLLANTIIESYRFELE